MLKQLFIRITRGNIIYRSQSDVIYKNNDEFAGGDSTFAERTSFSF